MHAKNTFGRIEKSVFLSMHVPQCMAKRDKLKKKKVLNNPKCSAGQHSNFSKQCQPALQFLSRHSFI
jgi:hypothetical protein